MDWVQRVWRCGAPIPARLKVDVARGADASDLVAALRVEVARGVHQGLEVGSVLLRVDDRNRLLLGLRLLQACCRSRLLIKAIARLPLLAQVLAVAVLHLHSLAAVGLGVSALARGGAACALAIAPGARRLVALAALVHGDQVGVIVAERDSNVVAAVAERAARRGSLHLLERVGRHQRRWQRQRLRSGANKGELCLGQFGQ